jgi:hypothetical protein
MITFACVLKSFGHDHTKRYCPEWVDKLYRGIKRNYRAKFDFVCLTDYDLHASYRMVPLETDSTGYWSKIELFRPGLFDTPVLYLDLDVIICRDITEDLLCLPHDRFLLAREPYRDIHNSSIMFWNGDYSELYKHYQSAQQAVINEYDHNLSRPGCLGDQAYIGENIQHDLIDNFVSAGFVGWIHHKIPVPLGDPGILVFTGHQKPSNNLHIDLVRYHWI